MTHRLCNRPDLVNFADCCTSRVLSGAQQQAGAPAELAEQRARCTESVQLCSKCDANNRQTAWRAAAATSAPVAAAGRAEATTTYVIAVTSNCTRLISNEPIASTTAFIVTFLSASSAPAAPIYLRVHFEFTRGSRLQMAWLGLRLRGP